MRYFYLRHTIVSLYFYFASSSATYILDKLVSISSYINFCFSISKIDSPKIFHECINTWYILSDIYDCFFFFFINEYFERNTWNAMDLRKKKYQRNWLSVIQRQFDLENLIYWKRGREKYSAVSFFVSRPPTAVLNAVQSISKTRRLVVS